MSKELEARLLASVPSVGHFQHLEELGVAEETFRHYGPMYRYIGEIIKQHNHLPRLLDLRATFNVPQYVQRKPEEYEWLLDEFLKLTTVQRIQDVMDDNVETYGENPKELLPALIKDLTRLQLPSERSASLTDQTALRRLERYMGLAEISGFLLGVPTGIRYFDAEYRIGWIPGELVGIIGRLYIGKSWMLMYFGALAWMFGKRILFLSPEMPREEAEARFDALVCGLHDVPVDVTELFRGFKPTKAQQEVLSSIANKANWITVTSDEGRPFRMGELPRLVRQFNPDILLIDGLLLVDPDSRGQAAWEQVKNLSYGLKNLAVGSNIIIIVTHQANRQAHNTAKPPGLHEIYMGDAFAQACDRVLVLSKPNNPPDTLRITIQKFRKGKPLHSGTDFEFLPGNGKVKEKSGDLRSTDGDGDLGSDLQEWSGDKDLLPLP